MILKEGNASDYFYLISSRKISVHRVGDKLNLGILCLEEPRYSINIVRAL